MHTRMILPEIDLTRCDGCGSCVRGCPERALSLQAGQPVFTRPETCTFCTDCEALCPTNAIHCAFEITWDSPTTADLIDLSGVSHNE